MNLLRSEDPNVRTPDADTIETVDLSKLSCSDLEVLFDGYTSAANALLGAMNLPLCRKEVSFILEDNLSRCHEYLERIAEETLRRSRPNDAREAEAWASVVFRRGATSEATAAVLAAAGQVADCIRRP